MQISKKATELSQDNGLSEEINQAYIDNVGEEYAEADQVAEAYQGEFRSDIDFAQELADQLGTVNESATWPMNCIDWEQAAREIMYDYFESNGFYFRNL